MAFVNRHPFVNNANPYEFQISKRKIQQWGGHRASFSREKKSEIIINNSPGFDFSFWIPQLEGGNDS